MGFGTETVRILHDAGRYNAAAYYSHQAAEKAAKALLRLVNEASWTRAAGTPHEAYGETHSGKQLKPRSV